MKRIISLLLIPMLSYAACGCGADKTEKGSPVRFYKNESAPVSANGFARSDYKVFIAEKGYKPGKLEPDEGCYLGSYVLANRHINFDMAEFDKMAGKEHALSVYNMRIGEEFPFEWVLGCVSKMKTPYITIKPPNNYSVFREDLLEQTARDFAAISVPIFVDFYPNPQSYTNNGEKYVDFYRKASEAFKEYAPNVALVISAESKSVYDFNLFYPGKEYVDWIGIILYHPLYANGEVNLRNYFKDLDYFYAMYQREKPLLVSQLGFSSYSTSDHRYASQESAKRLSEFYETLKNDYTRIKAINYMDFNNLDATPKSVLSDNFSVTQDEKMLASYRSVISDEYFISRTSKENDKTKIEIFRSYFPTYEDENDIYISSEVFEFEVIKPPRTGGVVINGIVYFSVKEYAEDLAVISEKIMHITINSH